MKAMTFPQLPRTAGPTLAIWIKRCVTGEGPNQKMGPWLLDRVILKAPNLTQDLGFPGGAPLLDTMSLKALDGLKRYMPLDAEQMIITSKDLLLDLGDLILQGLSVTGQSVRRGVQRVFFSFRSVIGGLSALFNAGRMPDQLSDMECTLSTRTLNDVLLPVLNLAAAEPIAELQKAGPQKIGPFLAKLKENHDEILFYTTLLSRFVAAKERKPAAAELECLAGGINELEAPETYALTT